MPPRESSQKIPMNCTATNRKPNMSWKMNGRASTRIRGASTSASSGPLTSSMK